MHKVGYVLGALLLLMVALPAFAQQPFSDVPTNHWAYNAVNDLAEKGLLEGYPDGTFKGKQALTRYEFAQAIARIMDKIQAGVQGPVGPPGPAGTGVGLTPEQQACLDKLCQEFGPELEALRNDLNALTKRVEDLETAPKPEMPKITVSGMTSWRAGLYGTDFGTQDVSTTGYPFGAELDVDADGNLVSPYGGINVLGFGTIPITDSLKDAFKASDFMTQKTWINFDGALSNNVDVKVSMWTGPSTNQTFTTDQILSSTLGMYTPNEFSGNGLMDQVQINEALVKYRTNFLTPVEITIGKQYFMRGQGLLVDNNQETVKAFNINWMPGDWSFGAIWGMLDREQFWGRTAGSVGLPALVDAPGFVDPETSGQDNINIYDLGWKVSKDWAIGGTYLASGFNEEKGWSVDLNGKAFGLDWYGEFAQLLDWPTGKDFNDLNGNGIEEAGEAPLSDSDNAWLAGLKWGSNNNFVNITGEYGQVDAGYAFSISGGGWSALNPILSSVGMYTDIFNLPLSRLHPRSEIDPHDINWVDRPLFLDATNIARGWHVAVTFPTLLGAKSPLSISYASGDGYDPAFLSWLLSGGSNSDLTEPDKWRDADPVWVVKLSRQFNQNVSGNLIYGRREVDNIMSPQLVEVPGTGAFAENDPIQVIRAEVCVAF